ncbi:tetratricopeptide repeat protein [Pyxidicoccus fallax]|uniref:Tetratricopeptide repeat protein n=1 Tax=Pyxidicoccus fallax TaxID=394095 RepID=A0A848LLF0_9BACT|nr:tetratricopeptide repeat protein [Pyxidicoccus fallax]NMO18566.1 tetratricopeptide repeat protein [Pyxidicoccus fallax]NPC83069.1 tetratricopeptide repeat protein [Pyxidicoccus fallax]
MNARIKPQTTATRTGADLTVAERRRVSRQVERHFSKQEWKEAERFLREVLRRCPEDHWLISQLAEAVYEQRRYRGALQLQRKAYGLAPRCPMVRFGLATAAAACGETRQARRLFQLLTRTRPETLATGECGEGLRWARGLIADAQYRLGRLAEDEGRKAEARRRYQKYLQLVERPALSIESRRNVQARLRALSRTP